MTKEYKIGLDIGSTTIKAVVLDEENNIIHETYERHFSKIQSKTIEFLESISEKFDENTAFKFAVSGSAGMGVAERYGFPFIQEVYATKLSAEQYCPDTDIIIELGGEDAKIIFLGDDVEVRMNGSCAGGTGAFIDQMAALLSVTPSEMNEIAKQYDKVYTVASRCGVFAKSDIQPLLNQGARKNDLAVSIFHAVVNQTIAGLAQGRALKGRILYLGGPLTFLSELRTAFDTVLNVEGVCPPKSLYYVAMGSALRASGSFKIADMREKFNMTFENNDLTATAPLFKDQKEYDEFIARHEKASVEVAKIEDHLEGVYLGIDAGSTTIKTAIISKKGELLHSTYQNNEGDLVITIKSFLNDIYEKYPNIKILSSAVTGYGEDLIKNAFGVDHGIVETIAHFMAAKKFMPNVSFIIDIGGQDIKCFKIHNDVIDRIYLNEACSSGCGSFLQTFANSMGYSVDEFSKLATFAEAPVELGSRCTVFMNSSVKQAQKDSVSTENISAGLCVSVVKNALYKVIRQNSPEELGKNIVVQGGTFSNNAVLRAFEMELDLEVVRPNISGLMGAFGAALYAMKQHSMKPCESTIMSAEHAKELTHDVKTVTCRLCPNHCNLTINHFNGGRKYISGNRCERPTINKHPDNSLNLYHYKFELLKEYKPLGDPKRKKIGIPMGLNMFELLPFWHKFFIELGFDVETSPVSDRDIYLKGQTSIPSDTVCYPAKLIHGHIEELVKQNVDVIFYPCMSYNIDENSGDNCYNCPVVAYYPEVINANMESIRHVPFIFDYIGLHRRKDTAKKLYEMMSKYFPEVDAKSVKKATDMAYAEYQNYMDKVFYKGCDIVEHARVLEKPIIVLAGRPYHIDPEINHGIDKLILDCGAAVVTEEVVHRKLGKKVKVEVLNQWTYHSRLYSAAEYVSKTDDMNFVQLVSFGCGCDAITTDECRALLEKNDKIYTQIKIDEIANLGATKIRIRSLFEALNLKEMSEK